jgi:hypothetical protein
MGVGVEAIDHDAVEPAQPADFPDRDIAEAFDAIGVIERSGYGVLVQEKFSVRNVSTTMRQPVC